MQALNRIARLSRLLGWVTSFLIYALPVTLILAAVPGVLPTGMLDAALPKVPPVTQVTPFKTALCLSAGWLALLPLIWALVEMKGLFARYAQGDILSPECARHILRTGQALVAVALMGIATRALQGLALTYDNPPGQKMLAIGIDGATAGFILAGGPLVAIGWVMGEAARVAEDNRGFL